jgi:hypothetical protein
MGKNLCSHGGQSDKRMEEALPTMKDMRLLLNFCNRFTIIKVAIETCVHIGSTIMYHVCRNKIFLFNKLSSFL